ncbi:unnamed protein product [Bursaphelenchus xylophilus]|uniref:(pine wood nematode) hypothetical protein n=1 Tax=Bursaphelenchus xylophilus TaxID=6326 RepID=A0A1I7RTZ3_BURXY|nr:unnamed protein product [Bursaphelenchus xylophilus]CAG9132075.1 unnamed protein product [Bursaphelenchus xylophilus]
MSAMSKDDLGDEEGWKPIINTRKRRACSANGNGECLTSPGSSRPKPEGRFAHTVLSLEMLGDGEISAYHEESYPSTSSNVEYRERYVTTHKDDYDPVMPNVIAEEVIVADEYIDVESAAKSPEPKDDRAHLEAPIRRIVTLNRPRELQRQQLYNLNQLNLDLKAENQRLRDSNARLKLALNDRGLKIKNILAENAKYCVMFKLLEKEFGVDAVKDVVGDRL